ncbi:ribosome hibernation promotion factor [Sphingomonas sp. MMS24-JH45]
MDIRTSGHQVAIGDALKSHVEEHLQGIADKYFARAISAEVTFGKGPHDAGFKCDIVAHVMRGLVLKGRHEGHDACVLNSSEVEAAASDAPGSAPPRTRRRRRSRIAAATTTPATPCSQSRSADEDEAGDAPLVIAETRVDVPDASVSDAVMMLDLRNTQALLFKNAGTGAYNMVYRRGDGTIGWVEPQRAG